MLIPSSQITLALKRQGRDRYMYKISLARRMWLAVRWMFV